MNLEQEILNNRTDEALKSIEYEFMKKKAELSLFFIPLVAPEVSSIIQNELLSNILFNKTRIIANEMERIKSLYTSHSTNLSNLSTKANIIRPANKATHNESNNNLSSEVSYNMLNQKRRKLFGVSIKKKEEIIYNKSYNGVQQEELELNEKEIPDMNSSSQQIEEGKESNEDKEEAQGSDSDKLNENEGSKKKRHTNFRADSIRKKIKTFLTRFVHDQLTLLLINEGKNTCLFKLPKTFNTDVKYFSCKKHLQNTISSLYSMEPKLPEEVQRVNHNKNTIAQVKSKIFLQQVSRTLVSWYREYLKSEQVKKDIEYVNKKDGEVYTSKFKEGLDDFLDYYDLSM